MPNPNITPADAMASARDHAAKLRAALLILNGRADPVVSMILLDLIAQATRVDDLLGALDSAISSRLDEMYRAVMGMGQTEQPSDWQHLGDWKLPTSGVSA